MSRDTGLTCEAVRELAPLYVLGALEPARSAAVRAHLASCPEAHEEVQGLGGAAAYLSQVPEPLEPPEGVGVRLMAAVRADLRARERDQAAVERLIDSVGSAGSSAHPVRPTSILEAPPTSGPGTAPAPTLAPPVAVPSPGARLQVARPGPGRLAWLALAAAVVLIAGLGAWNIGLRQTIDRQTARADVLRAALTAVSAPGSQVAQLKGSGSAADASGFAVLPAEGEAYLVLRGLPPAPEGKTYEAWVGSTSAVRAAGLFDVGDDGLAILAGLDTTGPPVRLVAVTLERAAGAAQPSGSPLLSGLLGG